MWHISPFEKQLITEPIISEILHKSGLNTENLLKIYGYIPIYDESAQNVLRVLNEYKNYTIVVQKINSREWESLLKYKG